MKNELQITERARPVSWTELRPGEKARLYLEHRTVYEELKRVSLDDRASAPALLVRETLINGKTWGTLSTKELNDLYRQDRQLFDTLRRGPRTTFEWKARHDVSLAFDPNQPREAKGAVDADGQGIGGRFRGTGESAQRSEFDSERVIAQNVPRPEARSMPDAQDDEIEAPRVWRARVRGRVAAGEERSTRSTSRAQRSPHAMPASPTPRRRFPRRSSTRRRHVGRMARGGRTPSMRTRTRAGSCSSPIRRG